MSHSKRNELKLLDEPKQVIILISSQLDTVLSGTWRIPAIIIIIIIIMIIIIKITCFLFLIMMGTHLGCASKTITTVRSTQFEK